MIPKNTPWRIEGTLKKVEIEDDKIVFTTSDGVLTFTAETDCCDCSWFVLGDIEKPWTLEDSDGPYRSERPSKFTKEGYYRERVRILGAEVIDALEEWGEVKDALHSDDCVAYTYGFKVYTNAGIFVARMANASNGYYSGSINCTYKGELNIRKDY